MAGYLFITHLRLLFLSSLLTFPSGYIAYLTSPLVFSHSRVFNKLLNIKVEDTALDSQSGRSGHHHHLAYRSLILNAVKPVSFLIESQEMDTSEFGDLMPDFQSFRDYYDKVVAPGLEMSREQFLNYVEVRNFVERGLVYDDDLEDLWLSATGDASGLNADEAYELLCMVNDLPDPDDIAYYDDEFSDLTIGEGGGELSYSKFLMWSDVQDMINEGALSEEEIAQVWQGVFGSMDKRICRNDFSRINKALDVAISQLEDEVEDSERESEWDEIGVERLPTEPAQDLWDAAFDVTALFDKDTMKRLFAFFQESTSKPPLTAATGVKAALRGLEYEYFLAWEDIQALLRDTALREPMLRLAWQQAVLSITNADVAGAAAGTLSFDSFLRLIVSLDLALDEMEMEMVGKIGDMPELR